MIVMCYFWSLLSAIHNTQLSGNLRGVDYANLRAAWHWLEVKETFVLWALPWWPGSRSRTHHQRLVASWPLPLSWCVSQASAATARSRKPQTDVGSCHSRQGETYLRPAACTASATCSATMSTLHFPYASLRHLLVTNRKRVQLSAEPAAIDFWKGVLWFLHVENGFNKVWNDYLHIMAYHHSRPYASKQQQQTNLIQLRSKIKSYPE